MSGISETRPVFRPREYYELHLVRHRLDEILAECWGEDALPLQLPMTESLWWCVKKLNEIRERLEDEEELQDGDQTTEEFSE